MDTGTWAWYSPENSGLLYRYDIVNMENWVSAVNIGHHHANVDYIIILAVTQIANYQSKENK